MSKQEDILAPGLYRTPFCKAYWADALRELKSVRMLAVAAVLIAVRVALKSASIPIVPPTLSINIGFFVNALGAGIFGPVMAILAAAVSDTLGCILFPNGVYFFPFIFTEIAGSLIFALFLYRAPRSSVRIVLSRFAVCFLVNIVIQSPIMLLYYKVVLGKSYQIFDLPRICKNLVLFPFESILLILFLNITDPLTYRMKLTYEPPKKRKISGRLIAFLLALFLVGAAATAGYSLYDYNTRNHASDFEDADRAAFNEALAEAVGVEDGQLVLVNTITRAAFKDGQTVTYSVYTVDPSADPDAFRQLKNSAAEKEPALTFVEKLTVIVDKESLKPIN